MGRNARKDIFVYIRKDIGNIMGKLRRAFPMMPIIHCLPDGTKDVVINKVRYTSYQYSIGRTTKDGREIVLVECEKKPKYCKYVLPRCFHERILDLAHVERDNSEALADIYSKVCWYTYLTYGGEE